MPRHPRHLPALLGSLLALALAPAGASAADSVYWTTPLSQTLSFARLAGNGAGNLLDGDPLLGHPAGLAFDTADGRVYWSNLDGAIAFLRADGSSAALDTGPLTLGTPTGVAIDPIARRIYWTDSDRSKISSARLDGGDARDLVTTGATVNGPQGLAVDPAAGRVYWANSNGDKISFARLDGSGGGDLDTTGATVDVPIGVALDATGKTIYWANNAGDKISFAHTDSTTGAGDLNLGGAPVVGPTGVAIDPVNHRVYWANTSGSVAFARDDSNGFGGVVDTLGTPEIFAAFPVLDATPVAQESPAIAGRPELGAQLTCSTGEWAPDLVASFYYRAPERFAFEWQRDGIELAGATGATLTATAPGSYRCTVTGTNRAGSASVTSAALRVAAPAPPPQQDAFGRDARVTLTLAATRVPARGPLAVKLTNANDFAVAVTLAGQSGKPTVKLAAKRTTLPANASKTLKLTLPKALQRRLAKAHVLTIRLTAVLTDPARHSRTIAKTAKPRLAARRGR